MIPLAFQQWVFAATLVLQLVVGIAIGLALARKPINWTPTRLRLRQWQESALRAFYGKPLRGPQRLSWRVGFYRATRAPRTPKNRPSYEQIDRERSHWKRWCMRAEERLEAERHTDSCPAKPSRLVTCSCKSKSIAAEAEWQTDERGELEHPDGCHCDYCEDDRAKRKRQLVTPVPRDYAGMYDTPGPLHIPVIAVPGLWDVVDEQLKGKA